MKKFENLTTPQRQRTSVPIIGLDLSTPDDLVKDGACKVLSNMRYNANAWRPVRPYTAKTMTTNVGSQLSPKRGKIVYNHPSAGENRYVVLYSASQTSYSYYDYNVDTNTFALIAEFTSAQKISHFGNVLYFNTEAYLFSDEKYIPVDLSVYPFLESSFISEHNIAPQSPWLIKFDKTIYTPTDLATGSTTISANTWYCNILGDGTNLYERLSETDKIGVDVTVTFAFKLADVVEGENSYIDYVSIYGDYWTGEHLMFAALRMKDGSLINASPLSIGISLNDYKDFALEKGEVTYRYASAKGDQWVSKKTFAIYIVCPSFKFSKTAKYKSHPTPFGLEKITLFVPNTINRDLIDSISLISTRIYPTVNYTNVKNVSNPTPRDFFTDNYTDTYPFYIAKDIPIKDLVEGDNGNLYVEFTLTSSDVQSLVNKPLYVPPISDRLSGSGSYDYNNRLHIFDVEQSLTLPSLTDILAQDTSSTYNVRLGASLKIGDKTYVKHGQLRSSAEPKPYASLILSAHDARIDHFILRCIVKSPSTAKTYRLSAMNSLGNNISMWFDSSNSYIKYTPIKFSTSLNLPEITFPNESEGDVREPNRLQVSATNNPFSLPFDLSYHIGSENNRIIAMQSATIKIGDEQVGALPLYVFTEEGIYALRAGESTLYSAINPINHDRIINPSTISVNGAVAYITERGVHILTGEGSQVISTPIHKANGLPDLDFLKGCVFLHPKQFNEILLYNSSQSKAYVYNLDEGYWSTRSLGGEKINTDELILFSTKTGTNTIYDLNDENESDSLVCTIETRPIKLGNVEYKRLETIIPRISSGEDGFEYNLIVKGSADGTTYNDLHNTGESGVTVEALRINPIVIRRTPFSAKYFTMMLNLSPINEDCFTPSISHLDFEWYTKYMRRMR